jgi:membrane-associated PAP2 superfamily phosphatase
LTSCPWELEVWGVARYIPQQWGVHDGAVVFPGGHASSALGLMPASLLSGAQPCPCEKNGRWIFSDFRNWLLFGLVQTLRGAHY